MKPTLPLSILLLEASATLAAKIVHMPVARRKASPGQSLRKRAGPLSVSLSNEEVLYIAQVTVGTPAQTLQLQLDTGSSDVWMTDSSASYCQGQEGAEYCSGGTFTPGSSTSYKSIANSDFNITYVDGSGSTGNYFTDDFTIGGQTITGLEMGLATDTTIGTGIIGVCFAADESICNGEFVCQEYPSIVSQMVSQGLINSQAYSLWLNDLNANTGSILFGGVDTSKYTGDLITIPIQRDSYSQSYTSFTVTFTSLTVTDSSGTNSLTSSNYDQPAILDSGTSLLLLPDDLFQSLTANMNLELQKESGVYLASCSDSSTSTTYNFQFGGSSGPTIQVASSEFYEEAQGYYMSNGDQACEFGILPAGSNPILFGDTFLRSAYVVYDLDNRQISLAQASFNSGSSNVKEIAAGANGVPGVSATVTGVVADATGTAIPYVQSASGSAGRASGTSAAVKGVTAPGSGFAGVIMMGFAGMATVLGSCFIFL